MEEIVLKRIVALLLILICLFSFTGCYGIRVEEGEVLTFYHVNNMFIKTDNSSWYKMNYEEAARFETLLNDLDNSR